MFQVPVIEVPTNLPNIRKDLPIQAFAVVVFFFLISQIHFLLIYNNFIRIETYLFISTPINLGLRLCCYCCASFYLIMLFVCEFY
jgi:hypothetical protein